PAPALLGLDDQRLAAAAFARPGVPRRRVGAVQRTAVFQVRDACAVAGALRPLHLGERHAARDAVVDAHAVAAGAAAVEVVDLEGGGGGRVHRPTSMPKKSPAASPAASPSWPACATSASMWVRLTMPTDSSR